MCRWIAYVGHPVFIEEFVCVPCQSLIAQSRHSRETHNETNADGFGIGWYGERPSPGIFRDIRPAWSDENLKSLASQIRAPLFFAHVRASTGTATTRANCHPFSHGTHLFMHNGQIGGYDKLRRRIDGMIPDHLYEARGGTTDSEAIFLMMLGDNLGAEPKTACERLIETIARLQATAGIKEAFRFTAAWSDGTKIYAARYGSDRQPPSLYTRRMPGNRGTLVVSEPLDEVRDDWQVVPPQSFVTVTPETVTVEPLGGPMLAIVA